MPKGHKQRFRISAALAAAALFACLALSGCLGLINSSSVAATVGSASISEDAVTEYIEGFRSKNEDCETDEGWASFLSEHGYTAESIREYVLGEIFIPREVIRAKCLALGISVSDEEVSSRLDAEKAYYEQRYGADSWESVLASYGYDEESWRENEQDRLLEERCREQVVGIVEPSQSQFQTYANENASAYNGKHSYYLRFNTLEDAQAVFDSIEDPKNVKLKDFKAMGEAVNAGWSSIKAEQKLVSTDYISALNALDVKEVSQPLEDGEGAFLILCNKTFSADSGKRVKLKEIPAAILAALKTDCADLLESDAFEDWLDEATDEVSVTINPMPSGLPYDVNVAIDD